MLDVLSSLENNALLCGVAVCSFQKLCSAQYGDQGIRDTRYPSTDTLEFQCICTALGYNVPYKVQSFTSNSALTDVKSSKFESTHLNISTIDF